MAFNPLTLGDFVFVHTEIPSSINVGGEQKLAVHQLAGGTRVVDAMGQSHDPISWSGLLVGKDALARTRYLDHLRKQGSALHLTWSCFDYWVIIQQFKADFKQEYRIPYTITCIVVTDALKQPSFYSIDYDQSIKEDMGAIAKAAEALEDKPEIKTTIQKLVAAYKTIKSIYKAGAKVVKEVRAQIKDVQDMISREIASIDNMLQNVTTLGGVLPHNPVSVNSKKMMNHVVNVNNATQLMNLKYTFGRVIRNIDAVNSPTGLTALTTVNVSSGASLYSLAAKHYGDYSKWDKIAKANSLSTPYIHEPMTLVIPNA